ncbi:hypothetical protein LINGRAHAP2_LOCUS24749 [Linum grandiflorum]
MTIRSSLYQLGGSTKRAGVSTSSTFMEMGRLLELWWLMNATPPWDVIQIMIISLLVLITSLMLLKQCGKHWECLGIIGVILIYIGLMLDAIISIFFGFPMNDS